MEHRTGAPGHSCLSTGEAAKLLGVSGATVRNWCRAGHLAPAALHPLLFKQEDVADLKERILNNRFNRLRKRANKTASDKQGGVDAADAKIAADLACFMEILGKNNIDATRAVYTAALHFLEAKGEATIRYASGLLNFNDIVWRRHSVGEVMRAWLERNGGLIHPVPPEVIRAFLGWRDCDDPLGLLYQGLCSVGRKARTGAYFTPKHIIDGCLSDLGARPESFLDPCCGTGRYLRHAAERFGIGPDRLFGFDADPVAVDIARLNLLLHYRELDFRPNVHCLDSLSDLANGKADCVTNNLLASIDAIATNPPWGGCKNQKRYKNLIALIKSGESFSLFLEKALTLLRPGGTLSFLLPEAVLRIKAHTDIRRLILDQTAIVRISLLGRVFSGVFTPIIRLNLVKTTAPADWMTVVENMGEIHTVPQKRFEANANHAFDVAVTPEDEGLLDKIYSVPHETLRGNADWALGIVTGDNSRCVLEAPKPGTEAVLRGRDVFRFAPRAPRCYIKYRPEKFQQVAPERHYRAPEKLIYRFVSDKLVFAYDDRGTLTLNSANVVIPRLPSMSMKAALAFLNSRVFQYIFTKKFRTRKILKSDLETLPFPLIDVQTCRRLERQVEVCMSGEYRPAEELDRMVLAIFKLSDADVAKMEAGLAAEARRVVL